MDWKNLNNKQQQNLLRLGLLALLGIALLLAGSRAGDTGAKTVQPETSPQTTVVAAEQETVPAALERQLAQTLTQIEGAGAVTVQITVRDLGRREYVRDLQRTERSSSEDGDGRQQQTTEVQETQTVVQQTGNQAGGALLVEETMPEVCGVLIVAEGAGQAKVKERLLQAASTVLQLSREQIAVLPGKGASEYE